MAMKPWAATQARATCVVVQPFMAASFRISLTMARFL
jgi:hypothetical protein